MAPLPCEAGTFSSATDLTAASECTVATPGHFATTGSTEETPCAKGSFAATAGLSKCELCKPGTTSAAGSDSCTKCAAGTYAANPDQGECTPCPHLQGGLLLEGLERRSG